MATISKAEADYVDHPVRGERCKDCSMFLIPNACTLVEGLIAEDGHCRYWEAKKWDYFEIDGAYFRRDRKVAGDAPAFPIQDVWADGVGWLPYTGDKLRPVFWGDPVEESELPKGAA